jgi:L-ascorbate metabolism protein UlaG (beta-lactamase superfamily)
MNRRHFLSLGAGFAALAAGAMAMVRPARANTYYSGPVSDHFDGKHFFNPGGDQPRGFADFLRWQLGDKAEPWPETFPSPVAQDKPPERVGTGQLRVSFIGHASFLIQMDGQNILLDPHFAERASPVGFAGPRRLNAPGIPFEVLPKIDTVLVSHNHYDHLDLATLHRLWDRDKPRMLVPLGNDTIIRADRPDIVVEAGDWGDTATLGPGLRLFFEPAQHWSARGTFDRRHALWASFVLSGRWGKLWFAGDTGFGDGRVFRALKAKHPDLRLGLLPIGAYEPRWFMRQQHINPEDAVEIFRILALEQALGYHWGTFRLTNEAVDAPPKDLAATLAKASLPEARFRPLWPGMVWEGRSS